MSSIVCRDHARKTASGPEEFQQGPGVSSSDYEPFQFYEVPVATSKVIRPPINRAFIKKYCAPQAGARQDTTAAWGWPAVGNRLTAATSRAPQLIYKAWRVAYDPWPTSR